MFHVKTNRQKNFYNILKYTKKRYDCDETMEKVKGRYEFNVYSVSQNELKEYLNKYNLEFINYDDFVVVREIKKI